MPSHSAATSVVDILSQQRWPPMNHQGANPGSHGRDEFACWFIERHEAPACKSYFCISGSVEICRTVDFGGRFLNRYSPIRLVVGRKIADCAMNGGAINRECTRLEKPQNLFLSSNSFSLGIERKATETKRMQYEYRTF